MSEGIPPEQGGEDSEEAPLVDQSELDALLAQFSDDTGEMVSEEEEDSGGETQGDMTAMTQGELDKFLAEAGKDESLTGGEIDSVLGEEEAAAPEQTDQAKIDALISGEEGMPPPEEEPAAGDTALGDVGLEEEPAAEDTGIEDLAAMDDIAAVTEADVAGEGAADIAAEPETVEIPSDQEMSAELEELGLEDDLPEGPPAVSKEEVARATEAAEAAEEGEAKEGFARWVQEHLAKLTAAVAAGLVCGMAAFVFLYTHRERAPDLDALAPAPDAELQQAMANADNLLELGRYREAATQLSRAVRRAEPGSQRTDALLMLIEAEYRALPQRLTPAQTEVLDSRMDDFLERAPYHARATDVLRWKADVYERAGLLEAARGVYQDILTNYAAAPDLDEVLLDAAELALEVERPEEAAQRAERLLQEFPGSPLAGKAKLALGEALVAAGQEERGRALLYEVARVQQHTELGAQAYARLGKVAFDAGRYDEAIAQLETRLETATTVTGNDRIYLLLAKAYRENNQPREAERVLRELLDFFPESEVTPDALILRTQVLEDLGERREAVRLATQAARRYPDDPDVLRNQAEMLALAGNEEASAAALEAASTAGAEDPQLLLRAGQRYHAAGELDDAEDALRRVIYRYPRTPEAFQASIELASVLREQGEVREAVRQLEDLADASEGSPRRLPVLLALGEMYQNLGLPERAGEIYAQVAVVTTEPEVLARSARALFAAEDWSQGLAVAAKVEPDLLDPEAAYGFLMDYGQALLRTDLDLAVEKMERAYERYPDQRTPEGNQQLLEAYLAANRNAAARVLVYNLASHVRNNPVDMPQLERAASTWGDYLYRRRDYRAAAEAYSLAIPPAGARSETAQWAEYQRANALMQAGDFDGSIAVYDQIAQGESAWAEEAESKANCARLEQRLRGVPVTGPSAQG